MLNFEDEDRFKSFESELLDYLRENKVLNPALVVCKNKLFSSYLEPKDLKEHYGVKKVTQLSEREPFCKYLELSCRDGKSDKNKIYEFRLKEQNDNIYPRQEERSESFIKLTKSKRVDEEKERNFLELESRIEKYFRDKNKIFALNYPLKEQRESKAFQYYFLDKKYSLKDAQLLRYVTDGSLDAAIDAYLPRNSTLELFQFKYLSTAWNADNKKPFTEPVVLKSLESIKSLFMSNCSQIEMSPKIKRLVRLIQDPSSPKKIKSCKIYFVSNTFSKARTKEDWNKLLLRVFSNFSKEALYLKDIDFSICELYIHDILNIKKLDDPKELYLSLKEDGERKNYLESKLKLVDVFSKENSNSIRLCVLSILIGFDCFLFSNSAESLDDIYNLIRSLFDYDDRRLDSFKIKKLEEDYEKCEDSLALRIVQLKNDDDFLNYVSSSFENLAESVFSKDDFDTISSKIDSIELDEFSEGFLLKIRELFNNNKFEFSSKKYKNLLLLAKASAYFNGRKNLNVSDFYILVFYFSDGKNTLRLRELFLNFCTVYIQKLIEDAKKTKTKLSLLEQVKDGLCQKNVFISDEKFFLSLFNQIKRSYKNFQQDKKKLENSSKLKNKKNETCKIQNKFDSLNL